jgi:pyruvate dehydrogenase E1 component alpha subunit
MHTTSTGKVGPSEEAARFGISLEEYLLPAHHVIEMLDQDGNLLPEAQAAAEPGHRYPAPSDEDLLDGYRQLVMGRRLNDQAEALVRQGKLAVYPSSHGQEACQVAAARVLGEQDWLFPTYRDSVAVATRGVPAEAVMTNFRGEWHQGYDPYEHKVSVQSTPLATQLLHAVGLAHAARLKGEDTVAMALCGDGATSEGDFHEALNFAAVFRVPVIFLVQNNGWAISVPLETQSKAPSLAHKAVGYGIAGERVDGNDLMALTAVLRRAVDLARAGEGPFLVEAVTYRMLPHTNADDDTRYRDRADVARWEGRDPLRRVQAHLREVGVLGDAEQDRLTKDAEDMAAGLRAAMASEPDVDPLELFDHVFVDPTPRLTEQRAELADELARDHEATEATR